MTSPVGDDGLLDLASLVMQQNGYEVVQVDVSGLPVALAEDEDNVIALAAIVASGDLVIAEPGVSRFLTERLVAATSASKKWDAYVVLLSAQKASHEQTEPLASLSSNLRQVRRIVRVGVEPTRAGVARALRPLLPLPTPQLDSALEDPLTALRALLLRDGLAAELVENAFSAFALEAGTAIESKDEEEPDVSWIGGGDDE